LRVVSEELLREAPVHISVTVRSRSRRSAEGRVSREELLFDRGEAFRAAGLDG
jgi:hypothetical protein